MYTAPPYEPPMPMYSNLIVCGNRHCEAQYDPTRRWSRGYYSEGTDGKFNPSYNVPEKSCPVCGTKQE